MEFGVDLALGLASHHYNISTMECLVEDDKGKWILGPLMSAPKRGCTEVGLYIHFLSIVENISI